MKAYENANPTLPHPATSLQLSRRQFLKRLGMLGGGLVVCLSLGEPSPFARQPAGFNAFL